MSNHHQRDGLLRRHFLGQTGQAFLRVLFAFSEPIARISIAGRVADSGEA